MDGINLKDVRPNVHNPRSNFDLSFSRKYDCKFGDLYPILVLPVMPSDEISCGYEFLGRMAPFISQVFQRYQVRTSFYYVPNRVLWHNFDKFITGGWNGQQTYIHPYFTQADVVRLASQPNFTAFRNILEAMDIAPGLFYAASVPDSQKYNILPFFAYLRCILDYKIGTSTSLNSIVEKFMDSELTGDGHSWTDFCALYNQLYSGNPSAVGTSLYTDFIKDLYDLDYFTSARSNTQLGPVMSIPLSLIDSTNGRSLFKIVNGVPQSSSQRSLYAETVPDSQDLKLSISDPDGTFNPDKVITINGSVFQNQASINDFYEAARVQEFLALNGFSGFLPSDQIASEFGVKNPDSRLQRAQFLGSQVHDWSIGEVFSNNVNVPSSLSDTTHNDIPGVGTAIAKATNSGRGFHHKVEEHGYIIGIASVIPEASYSEGVPRDFSKLDRFDYPHPMFANLGMQSIKNSELFVTGASNTFDTDFAYQPRYAEYKVGVNRVNGQMRQQLCFMNSGRRFNPLPSTSEQIVPPTFNDSFLRVQPSQNHLNRTFNVSSNLPYDTPVFMDFNFKIAANRPLPYFGLPKF